MTTIKALNTSNHSRVNKGVQYNGCPIGSFISESLSVSSPSSPPQQNTLTLHLRKPTSKIYFTTFQKEKGNTVYLRVFHTTHHQVHTSAAVRTESVTVSLRTNNRREGMMNSDYLKQRLLDKAGSFRDFNHMREYLKEPELGIKIGGN